ncbi:restriction endonuclease subunit S [Streptococcus sp. oral taxon 431]|uniref:restriction endonuclease subunit S n=1 Tax=Streptococcus sp. oral taxon 431 TaxID=712633 RepID=UPI0020050A4E|nr:restriction endonuclease subunit S [Streptococcus sp. oral taxon 431]
MSKNSIPKIRFYDFSDNWESKQIGELGSVAMNKRIFKGETSQTGEVPFYKIGTFGGEPDSFITRDKFEEYKSKYPYPEIGDILLSASGSIGRTVEYQGEEAYFQDSNIVWLKHDERLDNSFLKQFYSIVKWEGIEGTTIKRLYNKNILETLIALPSQEEQSAIGSLFRTFDNLLTSYKDNLTNYQSLKATMLSKMFPKAGQTVPEIRLDRFEGEWECLKMAEIFQIIDGDRGKSYPGEDDFHSVGHTLFLDTGNVKKTGLDFSSTKFISEKKDKELRNGKLILGDFILTSRGTLGNVAHYNEIIQKRYSSVRINSAMLILRPLLGNKISPDYILAVLRGNLISDFMKVNQVGSAQPHITKKEFSKIKVLVPSNIREQQAIGAYFSNLDNLINSHKEKISQLEILKKKLLKDMFI